MPGFWRKCRVTFRWFRFAVWLVLLTAIGALLWLNRVGVPDFLKTRIVTTLQDAGVTLEFSRLHLHPIHGFVAENVWVGQTNEFNDLSFSAREVQVKLNLPALLRLRVQVNGLVLRNGSVALALSPTNILSVTNLQTELRFSDRDTWTLDHLQADFNGARIALSGEIRHAPEMQHWKIFSGHQAADQGALARVLKDVSNVLTQILFEGQPQLNATLDGDARDVHSFTLRAAIQAPGVRTPWFTARQLELSTTLTAPVDIPATITNAAAWNVWTNAQPFRLTWLTRAAELHFGQLDATTLECTGQWHAPELTVSRLSAQLGGGQLAATAGLDVTTREATFTADSSFDLHAIGALLTAKTRARLDEITWTRPPRLHADGALTLPPWDSDAGVWLTAIEPALRLQGDLAFTNATAAGVPLDYARTHFAYSNRVWRLPDLELAQGRTKLQLAGSEDEATKNFSARIRGVLAVATVKPFLPSNILSHLDVPAPLALDLAADGNLYDLDRLSISGLLALTNATVYGSTLASVQTRFSYSNHLWRATDLAVAQGRTQIQLTAEFNAAAQDFRAHLAGDLDAASVTPFLTTSNAINAFAYLRFSTPLSLSLSLSAHPPTLSSLTATGHLALTNFSVREQTVDNLTSDLIYTNLKVDFLSPRLIRAGGTQTAASDRVTIDLAGKRLFLVNATGHVEPMVICRCIGPKTTSVMSAYEFPSIPDSRANGCIPLRFENGELVNDDADIKFDVVGTTPFHWRKFETPAITGTIHWLANDLILTNVTSECYGGEVHGWAVFDVHTPGEGTDLYFFMTGTNVDFHRMGQALWSLTNRLEGSVSGTVMVTSANSADWQTWDGNGSLRLQDGILWDVPIFGLISPMLNTVVPGLGNNRAKNAVGSFVMTNGVIRTDSLKIYTTTMQLEYDGTVDLLERVNARVTAQILRTTPVLGPLVSTVLWPVSKVFECRVTGTLGDPKATPLYVPFPKLLSVPFHPIRSMEEFFAPNPASTPTNTPAATP